MLALPDFKESFIKRKKENEVEGESLPSKKGGKKKLRKKAVNRILNRGSECVFLALFCCFLRKPDELARNRGRVHVKSIYRLKRTPWNDVSQILLERVRNVVNGDGKPISAYL